MSVGRATCWVVAVASLIVGSSSSSNLSSSTSTHGASSVGSEKVVINTPWWPAGTERSAEAIGILSHGEIFMTGMMEYNKTIALQVVQEMDDVSDIAKGGKTDLNHITSCLIHTKQPGTSSSVRELFKHALAPYGGAALTVQEMPGEYSVATTSITCHAISSTDTKTLVNGTGANDVAVASSNLIHVSVEGATVASAVTAASELLDKTAVAAIVGTTEKATVKAESKNADPPALVDCVVVLRKISDAPDVRSAFSSSKNPPALTIVQGGMTTGANVALHCTAVPHESDITATHTVPNKDNSTSLPPAYAVTAGNFVYASGIGAQMINATDGLVR